MSALCGLGVVDSHGTNVCDYELVFDIKFYEPLQNGIGLMTDVVHGGALTLYAVAVSLLRFATNPTELVEQLDKAYRNSVIKPLLDMFPLEALIPLAIGLLITVISFEGFRRSSRSALGYHFKRIATGFIVGSIVLILAADPFMFLKWSVTITQAFSQTLVGGADTPNVSQHLADTVISPMTQAANFGKPLSPACSAEWSRTIANGELPGCIDTPRKVPSGNFWGTVILGVAGLPMVIFSIMITVLSVLNTIGVLVFSVLIFPAAAVSIVKSTRFTTLGKVCSNLAGYILMIVMLTFLAIVGPSVVSGLAKVFSKMFKGGGLVMNGIVLFIGYCALCAIVVWLMSNKNKIFQLTKINTYSKRTPEDRILSELEHLAQPQQGGGTTGKSKPQAAAHAVSDKMEARDGGAGRSGAGTTTGGAAGGSAGDEMNVPETARQRDRSVRVPHRGVNRPATRTSGRGAGSAWESRWRGRRPGEDDSGAAGTPIPAGTPRRPGGGDGGGAAAIPVGAAAGAAAGAATGHTRRDKLDTIFSKPLPLQPGPRGRQDMNNRGGSHAAGHTTGKNAGGKHSTGRHAATDLADESARRAELPESGKRPGTWAGATREDVENYGQRIPATYGKASTIWDEADGVQLNEDGSMPEPKRGSMIDEPGVYGSSIVGVSAKASGPVGRGEAGRGGATAVGDVVADDGKSTTGNANSSGGTSDIGVADTDREGTARPVGGRHGATPIDHGPGEVEPRDDHHGGGAHAVDTDGDTTERVHHRSGEELRDPAANQPVTAADGSAMDTNQIADTGGRDSETPAQGEGQTAGTPAPEAQPDEGGDTTDSGDADGDTGNADIATANEMEDEPLTVEQERHATQVATDLNDTSMSVADHVVDRQKSVIAGSLKDVTQRGSVQAAVDDEKLYDRIHGGAGLGQVDSSLPTSAVTFQVGPDGTNEIVQSAGVSPRRQGI